MKFFRTASNLILSILIVLSLGANAYLYYYYNYLLDARGVEVQFLKNDIEQIRKQAEQFNSPEKQVERLTTQLNLLSNKILELESAQYKELKWLKYENKNLGISFEYPNLWGDSPVITTSTQSVNWSDEYIKKCIGGNTPGRFATSSVAISFEKGEVSVSVLKFSPSSPLELLTEYDCNVLNLLDRAKDIASGSNFTIGGYRGSVNSGINEGGSLEKIYAVITDDLSIMIRSRFDDFEDWHTYMPERWGNNWVDQFVAKYPDGQKLTKLKSDLEMSDRFVQSIKFAK